jgi:SagB-type dehydrogenase family enzyme
MARPSIDVRVLDEVTLEYTLVTGVRVAAAPQRREFLAEWPPPLPGEVQPILALGVRTFLDTDASVRFLSAVPELTVTRFNKSVRASRRVREVLVNGAAELVWVLLRLMDGSRTINDILMHQSGDARDVTLKLISSLASLGMVTTDRSFGRFLHRLTMNGVLPTGPLEPDDIRALVLDRGYKTYPEAGARYPLNTDIPKCLSQFRALTRRRRSPLHFSGASIKHDDLAALITTAFGHTGELPLGGASLRLRAYPSAGGLYSVEAYPVVVHSVGIPAGVYHYDGDNVELELLRSPIAVDFVTGMALPAQQPIIEGAAAFVFFTGSFPRFESKYGEGSYRVLVAEAGHMSQNLVLAATALGLQARPCGGFYDHLVNEALSLNTPDEQFLLGVAIGQPS